MKKFLAVLLCFCMMSVSVSATSLQFTIGDTQVKSVTGAGLSAAQMETAPFTVSGRTMVPVRIIAENFGAQVGWDEATQTVTVSMADSDISLVLGSSEASVNGEKVTLDVPATEQSGRTLVPLRFITETFGYNVKYLPSTEQIYITDSPIVLKTKYSFYTLEEFNFLYALMKSEYVPSVDSGATDAEIEYAEAMLASEVYELLATYAPVYDYLVYESGVGISAEVKEVILAEAAQVEQVLALTGDLAVVYNAFAESIYAFDAYYNQLLESVPETALQSAYEDTYLCAKHILIPTVNLQTLQPLAEEEVLVAEALTQDLSAQLANGADFDALMHEHSKDGGLATNPNGYVFKEGDMVEEFYKGALALKVGEIGEPIQSMFGYHIIKREALPQMDAETRELLTETVAQITIVGIMESNPVQLVMAVETLMALLP